MGLNFRKSFKIAPGVRVNVGKKSAGISFGGKYGGISFNSKSGARARISAPGTGLSYSTKLGKTSNYSSTTTLQLNATTYLLLTIFLGWFGIHRFYRRQIIVGILYMFTAGLFGIGWIVDIIIAIFICLKNKTK